MIDITWYIIITFMLAMYAIMDGFDFGAGIIHLFFAKEEKDKQLIIKSIGPFWDANEVWLLAAGGILFFAFPTLYASSFSGFYLPFMMILWLLILRAIGIELRHALQNKMWHLIWDRVFGLTSLGLALFFGLAIGNIVRGVNLGGVIDGVSTFEPQYFFLPLWNSTLSPFSDELGVIDWFTLILGFVGVVSITIHGATWIVYKTNSSINKKLKQQIPILSLIQLFLVFVSFSIWHFVRLNPFENFLKYPIFTIFPLLMIVGIFGNIFFNSFKKDIIGFIFSSLFILSGFISTSISLFPVLLHSTNSLNPSLTIFNTSSAEYGLIIGLKWFAVAFLLIIIYTILQFKIFSGKIDNIDYGDY